MRTGEEKRSSDLKTEHHIGVRAVLFTRAPAGENG